MPGKYPVVKTDEVTQEWEAEAPPPPAEVVWEFGYGPEIFPRTFPADAIEVNLDTLTGIPECVLGVYWLDETAEEWKFFIPGWESTEYNLHSLMPGEIYLVQVSGECVWTIPQV